MRTRTYEFYEVRTSMIDDDAKIIFRGDRTRCEQWMFNNAENVEPNSTNLYLVHVQLVQAMKADKK